MALPKSFKKSPKQDEDMPKNKSSLQDAMMMLGRRKPIMHKELTVKNEKLASEDNAKDSLDEKMMFAKGGRIPLEKQANINNAKDDRDEDMISGAPKMHPAELRAASMRSDENNASDDRDEDMVSAIMKRRRFAAGGQVDIDSNEEEQPNSYYHMNEEAALKENFDSDMDDMSQPADSNEHGDEREDETSDAYDMISNIRNRIKAKRGM